VPVELIGFESAGKMFEAVKRCWISRFSRSTRPADEVDFTPPYVEIEGPIDSAGRGLTLSKTSIAMRAIGVSAKSAYIYF